VQVIVLMAIPAPLVMMELSTYAEVTVVHVGTPDVLMAVVTWLAQLPPVTVPAAALCGF
jgi:hypothetical protein